MHILERIEAAETQYRFERRAGPQFAWKYFRGVLHDALDLLGNFSLMVEKVRLGEVPNNPAYAEHIETALIAIDRIKPYLGLKWLDLYLYKRYAIESRVIPYQIQYRRRQTDIIREVQWLITLEKQKANQANPDELARLELRLSVTEAKLNQII